MHSKESAESVIRDIDRILGEGGLLSRTMPGFEVRSGQIRMASFIAKALLDDSIAVVEAGTGIGKTIAYLLPILLTGSRAIISTGTKTLQEQIFKKDIPTLASALGINIRAAMMKGRSNYLCLYRFRNYSKSLFDISADSFWPLIEQWAGETQTGDRAELPDLPDDYAAWNQIAALPDTCIGRRCPYYKDCFLVKRNALAAKADIIVANHHLFFADLALKEGESGAQVLPAYDAVVFDEAHQLEHIATQYFGVQVASGQLVYAVEDFGRLLKRTKFVMGKGLSLDPFDKSLQRIRRRMRAFIETWIKTANTEAGKGEFGRGRRKLVHRTLDDTLLNALGRAYSALSELAAVSMELAGSIKQGMEAHASGEDAEDLVAIAAELSSLALRASGLKGALVQIFEPDDPNSMTSIYFYELRSRGITWGALPVDVSDVLKQRLFSQERSMIFTSATLSVGGSFDYFFSQLGIPESAPQLVVPSPFIRPDAVSLFVPRDFPEPSSEYFQQTMIDTIEELVLLAGGGVLVLFTGYANLKAAASRLRRSLPYPVIMQGEGSAPRLLEMFREDVNSVLLATGTFWEGVDVVGDSLRMVIIDKLPFDPPNDPFTEARINLIKQRGENAFYSYQLPRAVISLKQGVGRLLRSSTDSGLGAVLDTRLLNKSYGRRIIRSLYGVNLFTSLDEVRHWWQNIKMRAE